MATEPFNTLDLLGVQRNTLNQLMNKDWPQYKSAEVEVTFDGGTLNGIGDQNGTSNPYTLFTVTGVVEVSIFAYCSTDLAGASATVEVGTALSTAGLIAQATATAVDTGDIWHDASPDSSVELTSVVTRKIVSQDIILTVGTTDVTSGVIKFVVRWSPITSDGNLVAA